LALIGFCISARIASAAEARGTMFDAEADVSPLRLTVWTPRQVVTSAPPSRSQALRPPEDPRR
jgi:hypothetical protein